MANRFFVTTGALAFYVTAVVAQPAPISLKFEVFKNGKSIAQPSVAVADKSTANVTVDGVGKFEVTPTLRDADHIAVAFDVQSAGKQFKPRIVIGTEPGAISWTATNATDAFELRVKWVK